MAPNHTFQLSGYWLKHDDQVLETLLPNERDGAWLLRSFHTTAAYARARPYFEHAQRLYEALDDADDDDYEVLAQQCEAALQAIPARGSVLEHLQTGELIHPVTLSIRDDRAADVKLHPTSS